MQNYKVLSHWLFFFLMFITFNNSCQISETSKNIYSFAEIAGEASDSSIILKTRLSKSDTLVDEDGSIPGSEGYVRFEIDKDRNFNSSFKTKWSKSDSTKGFTVHQFVDGLDSNTRYYYRSIIGHDTLHTYTEEINSFKTLPSPESETPLNFIVASCMHYDKFMMGLNQDPNVNDSIVNTPASKEDQRLGYPAFEVALKLDPDFYISNGDNVYYDPRHDDAKTPDEMRKKWHQLFAFPRFQELAATSSTYWMKDDHDFRYDEADTTDYRGEEPSYKLGVNMFREQVPIVDPNDPNDKTYRTYRVNDLLQIWMTENRDYKSPNEMQDGPGKSIWGEEQKEWLKSTLKESDAEFKLLISPNPMIGPDWASKIDNHTNIGGFRHERDKFFEWLTENGFRENNFYIITGDRHWPYHSIHPSGFEEFSSGAFMVQNTSMGPEPGDSDGTDPEGLINQPFKPSDPQGGFLGVSLDADNNELTFSFYDENGNIHYEEVKGAN